MSHFFLFLSLSLYFSLIPHSVNVWASRCIKTMRKQAYLYTLLAGSKFTFVDSATCCRMVYFHAKQVGFCYALAPSSGVVHVYNWRYKRGDPVIYSVIYNGRILSFIFYLYSKFLYFSFTKPCYIKNCLLLFMLIIVIFSNTVFCII